MNWNVQNLGWVSESKGKLSLSNAETSIPETTRVGTEFFLIHCAWKNLCFPSFEVETPHELLRAEDPGSREAYAVRLGCPSLPSPSLGRWKVHTGLWPLYDHIGFDSIFIRNLKVQTTPRSINVTIIPEDSVAGLRITNIFNLSFYILWLCEFYFTKMFMVVYRYLAFKSDVTHDFRVQTY